MRLVRRSGLIAIAVLSLGLVAASLGGCGKKATAIASVDDFALDMSHEDMVAGVKRGCPQCQIVNGFLIDVKGMPAYQGATPNGVTLFEKLDKVILIGTAFDMPTKDAAFTFYNKMIAIKDLEDSPEEEDSKDGITHICRHKNFNDTQVNVCRNESDAGRYTVGYQRSVCVALTADGGTLCEK